MLVAILHAALYVDFEDLIYGLKEEHGPRRHVSRGEIASALLTYSAECWGESR